MCGPTQLSSTGCSPCPSILFVPVRTIKAVPLLPSQDNHSKAQT